jgi:hypothetical protein
MDTAPTASGGVGMDTAPTAPESVGMNTQPSAPGGVGKDSDIGLNTYLCGDGVMPIRGDRGDRGDAGLHPSRLVVLGLAYSAVPMLSSAASGASTAELIVVGDGADIEIITPTVPGDVGSLDTGISPDTSVAVPSSSDGCATLFGVETDTGNAHACPCIFSLFVGNRLILLRKRKQLNSP